MRKPYAKAIDARATELLRSLNLHSVPVDVEAVAKHLGADVVYEDLDDDVSGFLLRESGLCSIAVNKQHHPNRQRFTLAHECGHLYLHADKGDRLWLDKTTLFFRDSSSSSGDQFAEIQANQFAAGLLMPETLIKDSLGGKRPINEFDLLRLSMRFEVSERAMTVRLMSLGLVQSVAA
jgi:Zn-dependent peptidase ImmA (M78 family)